MLVGTQSKEEVVSKLIAYTFSIIIFNNFVVTDLDVRNVVRRYTKHVRKCTFPSNVRYNTVHSTYSVKQISLHCTKLQAIPTTTPPEFWELKSMSDVLDHGYEERLQTFNSRWPRMHTHPPAVMARANFVFLNQNDKVQCKACNGKLHNWRDDDDPIVEHQRYFPQCPFIRRYLHLDESTGHLTESSSFDWSSSGGSLVSDDVQYDSFRRESVGPLVTSSDTAPATFEAVMEASCDDELQGGAVGGSSRVSSRRLQVPKSTKAIHVESRRFEAVSGEQKESAKRHYADDKKASIPSSSLRHPAASKVKQAFTTNRAPNVGNYELRQQMKGLGLNQQWLFEEMQRQCATVLLEKGYKRKDVIRALVKHYADEKHDVRDAGTLLQYVFKIEDEDQKVETSAGKVLRGTAESTSSPSASSLLKHAF